MNTEFSALTQRHPLVAEGYQLIGGMPCTTRVAIGDDQRAGRWRGLA